MNLRKISKKDKGEAISNQFAKLSERQQKKLLDIDHNENKGYNIMTRGKYER